MKEMIYDVFFLGMILATNSGVSSSRIKSASMSFFVSSTTFFFKFYSRSPRRLLDRLEGGVNFQIVDRHVGV
jgi:hypothetical protein